MAYLILKNNELEQDEPYEKYYEFDADDRDTLALVEELLVMRSQTPDTIRKEIGDLLDDVSAHKKTDIAKKKKPNWFKKMVRQKDA